MFERFWRGIVGIFRAWIRFQQANALHAATGSDVRKIREQADQYLTRSGDDLRAVDPQSPTEAFAKACAACEHLLKLRPHDVQIQGALALAAGHVVEMQTGEGKTLSAVIAVYELARKGDAVHILTANDYLAERDAKWMGPVYDFLGLSVGYVTQHTSTQDRRAAYDCDVTYATANEVGFDFLRDQLVFSQDELTLPEFNTVLVDEADSILIDEARIPLVIAGGQNEAEHLARQMAQIARRLHPGRDFYVDEFARNVRLTDAGIALVEQEARVPNLFSGPGLDVLAGIEAALHARVLLRRDVDYLVRNNAIELVDEFKGRIAENRRWPAGLQTALEAKEHLPLEKQGRILGSITLQNLIRMYPRRCGMTGTALTEAAEFSEFYKLRVVPIPTDLPVIREDLPDFVFPTKFHKEQSVVRAIAEAHSTGRPVLVGTSSVEESERLSAQVHQAGIRHRVLNARQDAEEAAIIAQAGQRDAVTISTNMAGRGTDIRLGEGVAELGGLHVIGTNRHESRRVDYQLRGRAGRQGDPGSSRFYVSLQDDLMIRYGIQKFSLDAEGVEAVQRLVEGENFQVRKTLWKYDGVVEGQRKQVQDRRRRMLLEGADPHLLQALDEIWADHLAALNELKDGIQWRAWGGRDPYQEFIRDSTDQFDALNERLDRLEAGHEPLPDHKRGATWTYLVTDAPFGNLGQRGSAGLRQMLKAHGMLVTRGS